MNDEIAIQKTGKMAMIVAQTSPVCSSSDIERERPPRLRRGAALAAASVSGEMTSVLLLPTPL